MTRPERDFTPYRAPKIPPLGHEGLNTIFSGFYKESAFENAHRLCAALALFRATAEDRFMEEAVGAADSLCALQLDGGMAGSPPDQACFQLSAENPVLANSFFYFWETSGPLGLLELLKVAPEHPHASAGDWMSDVAPVDFQAHRRAVLLAAFGGDGEKTITVD